jgi:NADP-dependent 3-hydroxy acid dehydrogenase YdfG
MLLLGREQQCPDSELALGMRAPFRVVIITGASSGLGAELATAYAAPAVTIGLLGRDRQHLAAIAGQCKEMGAKVDVAAIDVPMRRP